ncbi:hypothetical protein C815_01658 [Firmicutes bacterium M10-2]|nr:hypothetical protein C815_01658 [Firmicutes bacterium M10-2]
MQTTIRLNVNDKDLFEIMERSLLQEVNAQGKKQYKPSDIGKGFSYTKRSGKRQVKVHILNWKKPHLYEARFTSDQDMIEVAYQLDPISDRQVDVTYKEVYRKNGKDKSTFTTRLVEKKAVKQAVRMLKAVEKAIQEDHSS